MINISQVTLIRRRLVGRRGDALGSALVASDRRNEDLNDGLGVSSVFASFRVAVLALAHLNVSLQGGLSRARNALPVAVAVASAALLGALRPLAVHDSVLTPGHVGVGLSLSQDGALLAAIGRVDLDRTSAAKFIGLGNSLPEGPVGHHTVNRAFLGVALYGGRKLRADGAAVVRELLNGTGAGL